MIENEKDNGQIEIDLSRLISTVWKKFWLILLVAVMTASLVFGFTYFFVAPKYQSKAMFYVNNSDISMGDASFSITTGDISASKSLVASYIVILNSRTTLLDVIDYSGVDRSVSELQDMITASAVNATEIFEIVVTGTDPQEATDIANAIAYILPKRISTIIEGTSAKVVDTAVLPTQRSSPSYTHNTMMGFLVGAALTALIIVLHNIMDTTIHSEEDIASCCNYPVLAAVPDVYNEDTGNHYGAYAKANKKANKKTTPISESLVDEQISFSAAEAYKLLRTKILFSFADDSDCHVIGVTSSLAGEGKSTTTVYLAQALAQMDKRVLLMDCDFRRPSIPTKLRVQRLPGITNYLTRQVSLEEIIQISRVDADVSFHVAAAGRNPPNPVELLSSERMVRMIEKLRSSYDYILLDLPPVDEVTDAVAASSLTDGMLMVVRRGYCSRPALSEAVRQFSFIGANVLGVVQTWSKEMSGSYGKAYYKKYSNTGAYKNAGTTRGGKYAARGNFEKKQQ